MLRVSSYFKHLMIVKVQPCKSTILTCKTLVKVMKRSRIKEHLLTMQWIDHQSQLIKSKDSSYCKLKIAKLSKKAKWLATLTSLKTICSVKTSKLTARNQILSNMEQEANQKSSLIKLKSFNRLTLQESKKNPLKKKLRSSNNDQFKHETVISN